jgi:hypothetical protein
MFSSDGWGSIYEVAANCLDFHSVSYLALDRSNNVELLFQFFD